jgi:hypothetical protein
MATSVNTDLQVRQVGEAHRAVAAELDVKDPGPEESEAAIRANIVVCHGDAMKSRYGGGDSPMGAGAAPVEETKTAEALDLPLDPAKADEDEDE